MFLYSIHSILRKTKYCREQGRFLSTLNSLFSVIILMALKNIKISSNIEY